MCFTPKISITTALLEFLVAGWLTAKFPKMKLAKFLSAIMFILGLYQFTEFMLCTTNNPQLWGKIGFLAYTPFPAIGLLLTISYNNQKSNKLLIFTPTIIFSIIALLDKNFIVEGVCSGVFVIIRNRFFFPNGNPLPTLLYTLYYYFYIALIVAYLYRGIKIASNRKKVIINLWIGASVLLTILTPLIFILLMPAFGVQFPSIYCQVAMFFTLTAVITVNLERKLERKNE